MTQWLRQTRRRTKLRTDAAPDSMHQAAGAEGGGGVPAGVSLSTVSRISLPGLNLTTARGGIGTSFAGELGLRPMRALRTFTSNTPKFRNSTVLPCVNASATQSSVF